MTKRMLIDASHPEETRVVVADNHGVSEFDYEIEDRKPLKGNIYLAKVTRVEPSLQAAFVDYGGNRHGFLPFSEIHPDYYRLPIADREALIAEERAAQRAGAAESEAVANGGETGEPDADAEAAAAGAKQRSQLPVDENGEVIPPDPAVEQVETTNAVETLADDDLEEAARRRAAILGRYKIQEVIKRRQVILVQVVKEERGTKGAALSTYLSLAGRYCVLMPNTDKGGGVSRKISDVKDRKRLKTILADFKIPEGMAVIVRTAGSERTKAEIKRDYDYLLRLWDQIRETTLQSTAPSLIHEEANLIKRSIRDLYTRDMDEVLVQGETGYKVAKSFMRSLMPSHAKKVQRYSDPKLPIFHRFHVEQQLDNIHSASVQLRSGGYIVINQTEALVAIDVNSGKSTKERHIEETALKTNLEAADEVARQLKLRDMAGLIVIDFIDMDAPKNNKEVEQRLKDAMRHDRARIQLGRISPFGLLELSRQRLRPSVHETSTEVCPHCGGSGFVRSPESTVLHIMRALEEEGVRRGGGEVSLTVPSPIAMYILNEKRPRLQEIEQRYSFRVRIETDNSLIPPAHRIDRLSTLPAEEIAESAAAAAAGAPEPEYAEPERREPESGEPARPEPAETADASETEGETGGKGKRGRRGGRKKRKTGGEPATTQVSDERGVSDVSPEAEAQAFSESEDDDSGSFADVAADVDSDEEDKQAARKRRRGKRGGRRRSKRREDMTPEESAAADAADAAEAAEDAQRDRLADTDTGDDATSDTSEAEVAIDSSGGAGVDADSGGAAAEKSRGRSSRGGRKRTGRGRSRIAAAAEETAEQGAARSKDSGRPAESAESDSASTEPAGETVGGGAGSGGEGEPEIDAAPKRRSRSGRGVGSGTRKRTARRKTDETPAATTAETSAAEAGTAATDADTAHTPTEPAPGEHGASEPTPSEHGASEPAPSDIAASEPAVAETASAEPPAEPLAESQAETAVPQGGESPEPAVAAGEPSGASALPHGSEEAPAEPAAAAVPAAAASAENAVSSEAPTHAAAAPIRDTEVQDTGDGSDTGAASAQTEPGSSNGEAADTADTADTTAEAPFGEAAEPTGEDTLASDTEEKSKSKRKGWWQKLLG